MQTPLRQHTYAESQSFPHTNALGFNASRPSISPTDCTHRLAAMCRICCNVACANRRRKTRRSCYASTSAASSCTHQTWRARGPRCSVPEARPRVRAPPMPRQMTVRTVPNATRCCHDRSCADHLRRHRCYRGTAARRTGQSCSSCHRSTAASNRPASAVAPQCALGRP